MDDKVKTGKSKQLQLENWKECFSWINPTPQTFKITEIFGDAPKNSRDNWGGKRTGSGAKAKVQEEFDYIFNALLHREYTRNSYNPQPKFRVAHLTNSEMKLYFGLYNSQFYLAHYDENVDEDVLAKISKKIQEKLNSWVFNKIKRLEDISFSDGIIAYINDNDFVYRDDLLEQWLEYRAEFLKSKEFKAVYQVIENDMWNTMIDYISSKFEDYKKVIKCKKVEFDNFSLKEYDLDVYKEYRLNMNRALVADLKDFFANKYFTDGYNYVIDKYVQL